MQQEQDDTPRIASSPYLSPRHQYGDSILLMTNPDDELYKMELTFRSMTVDKNGNPFPVGDPLMNDYGVCNIIGTIRSIVSQITVMSNLSKQDIPMLMDFLSDTLAKDLMENRYKYEIKNNSTRDKIFFVALSTAFITMKRPFEEGERKFWKGSVQELHTRVDGPQKKGGILSVFNPKNW